MSTRTPLDPYVVEITREVEQDGYQVFTLVARIRFEAADYATADAIGLALTAGFQHEKGIRYHTNASEDEDI